MNEQNNAAIIPFTFQETEIRTLIDETGNPLFVAVDVAKFLGYKDTVNAIKQHCKGVVKHHPLWTAGGTQNVRVIYEPDLFRLVANSKLPEAVVFEKWIFEVVLPSIRKTGGYSLPDQHPALLRELLIKIERIESRFDRLRPSNSALGNVVDFIEECCEHGFNEVVEKSILYHAYVEFCTAKGQRISSRSHFFMKLYRTDKAYNSTLTRFGQRIKAVRGLRLVKRVELAEKPRQLSLL